MLVKNVPSIKTRLKLSLASKGFMGFEPLLALLTTFANRE